MINETSCCIFYANLQFICMYWYNFVKMQMIYMSKWSKSTTTAVNTESGLKSESVHKMNCISRHIIHVYKHIG